jgi:hypothetical protein
MDSVLLILGLLLIGSFIIGYIGFIEMDFVIEFKSFSNPYFHIGLSFTEHSTEDPDYIEQELVIGLFIVNILVIFYKEKN